MPVKQSFCYPMMKKPEHKITDDDLLRAAAEIGYAAVEFWMAPANIEELAGLARRHNLAIATFSAHGGGTADGLNNRANHERIEQETKASIDLAARLGVPGLICLCGNRQPYTAEAEAIDACADGLRRVAPYAEKKGVNLNLELLNSKVDHPGYQCDHTAWGVAVCQKVNSPRVRLLYDIYHMQIMEGDVIRTIRQNVRYIGHFHTAGNPGRGEFDDTQELNYRGICRAIAQTGYDLYVGHEFRPGKDLVASLRKAFEVCNG